MSFLPAPMEPVRPGVLPRLAPVTRIVVGAGWLLVAVLATGPLVPGVLSILAGLALVFASGLPLERVPTRLAPLWLAGLGLGLLTVMVYPGNADPALVTVARLGPVRITEPALVAGLAITLRLVVIALVSVLVFATSDPTRLADSLVQQWHLPYRFAYGTLAALRIVPLLAADWTAIRSVRRLRGIEAHGLADRVATLGGELLVLLISAIRRAERMALAMDARGFDTDRPRGVYRPIQFGPLDVLVLVVGLAAAGVVLVCWGA